MDHQDDIVLVTGAASGIGLGTAKRFIEEGATVIGADYDREMLSRASQQLGDKFLPIFCDVSREDDISGLCDEVGGRFGRIDVLVNNAGRAKMGILPEDMKEEDFYYHYDLLIKGPMLMVKCCVPLLRRSSHPAIVNIASCGALAVLSSGDFLYSTAKAALDKYTRHLVRALPEIRSNTVFPGLIATPLYTKSGIAGEGMLQAFYDKMKSRIACGRVGTPEDVANCILFLSSGKAAYINGASIVVDGGFLCSAADWGV